ncbi:MAG: translation initiation factor IF-2 [Planctomycetia bacterium]
MPVSKRFYHVALELSQKPRDLMRTLQAGGLSVGNQMTVVQPALEQRIREVLAAQREAQLARERMAAAAQPVAYDEPAPAGDGPEPVPEQPALPPSPEELARLQRAAARRAAGEAPKSTDLVPTLDPRAGRLVREAPKGGVGVQQRPPAGRGRDLGQLNPTLPSSSNAPGARPQRGRRTGPGGGGDAGYRKQGKETFFLRPTRKQERPKVEIDNRPKSFEVTPPLSVKKFSELSGLRAADIVKVLFTNHKLLVTTNSMLDQATVEILALEFSLDLKFSQTKTAEDVMIAAAKVADDPKDLIARPPVVTILGHVDHGKTTLLDRVRKTDVAAHEAGGITQHIGASQVTLPDGRKVTFIDTPGHAAFTEMRARGAQVTDVVVLVVAADDGPMPQTVEAISHARAAGVPIVVAITKCDKHEANPSKVKQALTEHGVFCEGFGGDVSAFEVSGATGKGVPELLEHLALLVEVDAERFRSNPKRPAEGVVIESQNSPKRGIVATLIVRNGTLRKGDPIVAGEAWGTVRAMVDDRGQMLSELPPGSPAEVIGLDRAPDAGSKFYAIPDRSKAEEIAQQRRQKQRERELAAQTKPTTVESLLTTIDATKVQGLNLVIKADVKGSLEPLKNVLTALGNEEVKVKVLHAGVGAVNENDVALAGASKAWIIAFHVGSDEKARAKAKMLGVQVRPYKIIYEVEDDVKAALEGKLAPEVRETVLGHALVLKVFPSSKLGNIAGCRVKDGQIKRDALVRVKRDGKVLAEGKLASLRREKDEAREVREGFECGLRIEGFDAWQEGDELECFSQEMVARKLG